MRNGKIYDVYVGRSLKGIVNEASPAEAWDEAQELWGRGARVYPLGTFRSVKEKVEIAERGRQLDANATVPAKKMLH